MVLLFYVLVLFEPSIHFHSFRYVWVTEWPPIGEIAAYSAYDMFSKHSIRTLLSIKYFSPPRFLD